MLRTYYINNHPLCEECLKKDIVTAAEHVHHKVPFLSVAEEERQWELLLDENNLEAVCIACHNKLHKQLRHTYENI